MNSYRATFVIRWSDLDPNRHVANTAYMAFMNHTRMNYLFEKGYTQAFFAKHNFGPVIFSEEYHYFKEVMPNTTVQVDLRLLGLSADRRFVRFTHRLFNHEGELAVLSILTFGWMDLQARKLIAPPEDFSSMIADMEKAPGYRELTSADTRKSGLPID